MSFDFKIKKGYVPAIILGFLLFSVVVYAATHNPCWAPGSVASSHPYQCYSADANGSTPAQQAWVQEFSFNKCVQNGNPLDIFIPTKTSAEWASFRTAAINPNLHVTLTDLANGTCGEGIPPGGGTCPQDFTEGEACVRPTQAPFTPQCTGPSTPIPTLISQEPNWGPQTKSNGTTAYNQMAAQTNPRCICENHPTNCHHSCTRTINGDVFNIESETEVEVSCNGGACGGHQWFTTTVLTGPNQTGANCSL